MDVRVEDKTIRASTEIRKNGFVELEVIDFMGKLPFVVISLKGKDDGGRFFSFSVTLEKVEQIKAKNAAWDSENKKFLEPTHVVQWEIEI